MKYNPAIHHRRSIRLQGYDYAQAGAYFVTMVAKHRACLFGEIVGGEMRLNRAGKIVCQEWQRLEQRLPQIQLGTFVVMPNHIHAIVIINDFVGATRPGPKGTRSDGVGATRPGPERRDICVGAGSDAARSSRDGSPLRDGAGPGGARSGRDGPPLRNGPARGSLGAIIGQFKSRVTKRLWSQVPIWQRNYYERIIRSQDELERIHLYIEANPIQWAKDWENSENPQ